MCNVLVKNILRMIKKFLFIIYCPYPYIIIYNK